MTVIRRKKPRIGVTTSRRGSLLTWWCHKFAVWRAGGTAVRLRPKGADPDTAQLDGLVVGGGDDIDASLYNGEITLGVRTDPDRDALEHALLKEAYARELPVLGICRGSQMINVSLGGTLHRDIYEIYRDKRRMRTILPKMDVHIVAGSRLNRVLDKSSYRVNSLHHQAVDLLGDGLQVAARDTHGVVQAVESTEKDFVIGVQWHPEFLILQRSQQSLFRALVAAAA